LNGRHLARPKRGWEVDIKIDLKEKVVRVWAEVRLSGFTHSLS
jgi:hypothetical protein